MIVCLLCSSTLFANVGAILIIPKKGDMVVGVYSGISQASSRIDIKSTNSSLDAQRFSFDNTNAVIGGYIGVENSYYRLSFSYDINNDPDVELQRALMNFDFKFGEENGFRPLVGFGVGVAKSSYDIYQKTIKDENGVLAFRAGAEYRLDQSNSIEVLLEYSYILTSGAGESFYDGNDFTTYTINKQNSITLRIGYNFEF